MGAKSDARKFVRTDIPAAEKAAGGIVILILIAIGAGIYLKGRSFDPATYALDPAALESTRAAITGIAATLGAEGLSEPLIQSGSGPGGAADQGINKLIPPLVDGVNALGPTEHYTPDTLFEKINGRAPAYIGFNFQELTSRTFGISGATGQYVDVFLFWMDNPLNAFGIFSLERDPSGTAIDFAPDGYRSEMGYFLRKGPVYVQIIASSPDETVMASALGLAKALSKVLPADNSGLEARMLLPSEGQVPGSLTYVRENAYGQAAFNGVFEASYVSAGNQLTYFAMVTDTEAEAQEAWSSVREFYSKYGTVKETAKIKEADLFIAENFGEIFAIALDGRQVSGVINATDEAAARRFMEEFLTTGRVPDPGAAEPRGEEPANSESEYGYE